MLNALVQIGSMIKKGVLQQFPVESGTVLISLNFDTKSKKITLSIDREITSEFLVQAGYRGVKRGSGKEYSVIFLGEKKQLKYIGIGDFISKNKFSLWNIYQDLKNKKEQQIDLQNALCEKLENIFDIFYEKDKKENFKLKNSEEILKDIERKRGNSLYYIQICVDGNPLWKVYNPSKGKEIIKQRRCCVCGNYGTLKEFDTNELKFIKFFGKDKLGFYPDMSLNNQWKVLPLCNDCAESIVTADLYFKENKPYLTIANNLNLLILPFIQDLQNISLDIIKRSFETLIKAADVLGNWKELNQFDVYSEKIFKRSDIKLHLLISLYDGQTLKIYSSLTNIPPSRIRDLALAMKEASLFISAKDIVALSLLRLYKILAGREGAQSQRSLLVKEKFAEVFKNLILGNPMPELVFIKPGIDLAKWDFENREKLNNVNRWMITIQIVEGFLLIKELMTGKRLNLDGGKQMDDILEQGNKYVDNNPIYREGGGAEIRRALFFLGYLLSQIAAKQRKKGLKDAILNKIQFKGMNKNQILRLFNEVIDYLRIYELWYGNNIKLSGKISEIFDKNLQNWRLSPEENVYFILSGYAFSSSRIIDKKQRMEEKDE